MFDEPNTWPGAGPPKAPNAAAARAELEAMTLEQLNALPVYVPFTTDIYPVVDGEAVLRDGRKLSGLHGQTLKIPRQNACYAFFVGDETPLMWQDENGATWRPVLTPDGWQRERS